MYPCPTPQLHCRLLLLFFLSLLALPFSLAQFEVCSTWITVSQDTGVNCSSVSEPLANKTCSDLQDVLWSISINTSSTSPPSYSDCIDISVQPGAYVITEFIYISQNLKLHGDGRVAVMFDFTEKFDPSQTNEAQFVWSFFNVEYIEIRGFDFPASPGIITVYSVTSVLIRDCSFRNFFQGALDIYNCDFLRVVNCTFEDNGPTSVIKQEPYRGHAGGLSIGYNNTAVSPGPVAFISGCTFRNNTSDPISELVQTTTQLLQSFAFTGRGGGCAFPINPVFSLNATVEDSLFENNFARSFGGGLYVAFNGREYHIFTINRVKFVKNYAPTAGALEVGFIRGGVPGANNQFFAYNSEFIENDAMFGGGVYFFTVGPTDASGNLGNFAHFDNCTFVENTAEEFAAAVGVVTLLYFQEIVNVRPFQIKSCTFIGNDAGGGGALGVAYFPLSFSGDTLFQENRGRTLVVAASRVEVRGGIHFVMNDGVRIDGGAMYLTSLGQLELFRGTNITFQSNTGTLGAALVGDTLFVPSVVSRLAYNPLCLVFYEDFFSPPDEWENVSISFSGNQAVVSSAVYVSNLDLCSYVRFGHPWFDPTRVFRWDFVDLGEDNRNTAHYPDEFNPEWYVQTPAESVKITTPNVNAYPGEEFLLGTIPMDEINRPTSAVIRIRDLSDDVQAAYIFDPGVITFDSIALSAINTSFYTLKGASDNQSALIVETLLGETTFFGSFWARSLQCPPGYRLSQVPQETDYRSCACNFDNNKILECDRRDILIEEGLWGTVDNASEDSLFLYPCPPGYCRCVSMTIGDTTDCLNVFTSSDYENQCKCNRQGELCGNCRDGKGVSALLNRCVSCSDASGLLILAMIVADAGIFIVLLLVMRPFPTWVYPCVFYLQILPYLTLHFPRTFDIIQPPLYYISSALSFYFIYDFCLYSSMSAQVSYFLRYLPLFVIVITAATVLSIRRYLKKHALPWHGLWWIVLLLYTHILHTSMSILNCPVVPGKDGSRVPRWYINGNVKCFTGGHAALGLLAILILGVCVAIIPLSLVYITGKLRRPWVFRRSFQPLIVPFKEQYKWWACVELGRRIMLVLFIVSFPQNEYPAVFILMVTLAVYGYVQPFEQLAVNILEVILSINTIVLLLLENTETISDDLDSALNQTADNVQGSRCQDEVDGVTDFSWLLMVFYYLPLIISCSAGGVWLGVKIRHYLYKKWHPEQEDKPEEMPPPQETHGVTEVYLDIQESTGDIVLSSRPTETNTTVSN